MKKQILVSILLLMLLTSVNSLTIQGSISSGNETISAMIITLELHNSAKTSLKTINTIAHNGYFMQTIHNPSTTQIAETVVMKVNGQTFSTQVVNERAYFDIYLDTVEPISNRQIDNEPQNAPLFSIPTIGDITNFSNEILVLDMDFYYRGVHSYQNKLLIVNQYSVEEFNRLPDGSLERLSRFEGRFNYNSYFDEDRLYIISINDADVRWKLTVFDLSQTPMQKLTSFNLTDIIYPYIPSVIFSSQHIMMSSSNVYRTFRYDKTTFQRDGDITSFSGWQMYKKDNLLIIPKPHSEEPHPVTGTIFTDIIEFYNIDEDNDYELTKLSEIPITYYHIITDMEIQNGKFVLSHWQGVIIIDIDDIENPEISHYLWTDYQESVDYAIYTGDYLYASVIAGFLYVYQIEEEGGMALIFSESNGTGASGMQKNMELHYPYLYMNKNFGLRVYDVSNEPTEVFFHGRNNWSVSYSLGGNDLYALFWDTNYVLNNNLNKTKYDIYSTIENKLIHSLVYDVWKVNMNAAIKDDLLLVAGTIGNDLRNCHFEIYKITDDKIEFMQDFKLNHGYYRDFRIIDDLLFFDFDYTHVVYRLQVASASQLTNKVASASQLTNIDYELEYIGSLQGYIQHFWTNQPKDYVINVQNNNLIFRDINDFENILFSQNVSGADGVSYHNDDYLITMDTWREFSRIQNFSIENEQISLLHTFPRDRIINTFNGIIIKNAYNDDLYSEFYSIYNGRLHKVGEKDETDRTQWHTFFYPEINKMVQFAYAGVWVYDFDYTVSENDFVDPISLANFKLIGNYPNPFNPETTIRFNVAVDSIVLIDIYNIRGQKVRKLFEGFLNSGEHTAIWNGLDDIGRELSSGVYFYKMAVDSDDFVAVKRMILLK
ncbi:MAG: T9SS type A sorting domain-containing protein [Candidatus Cloacimonetes bacterium]|nr:T9SS type A sorting domain-containing protein [Candidatus Cloacimonadota bacterium]